MLVTPPGLTHYATDQSHSIGHDPQIPIAVTVEHRYDSADPRDPGPAVMVYVRTRLRQARGEEGVTTAQQNLVDAVHGYLEGSAARAGVSIRPGTVGRQRLDDRMRQPLSGWSWREVTVDNTPMGWPFVSVIDHTTNDEIIGTGGAVGITLVAVVGPARLLDRIELALHHPQ